MKHYLIIGNPSSQLTDIMPVLEERGMFKCLGIVEDMTQALEGGAAAIDFVIINLDCLKEGLEKLMEKLQQRFKVQPDALGITDSAERGFHAFKLGFRDVLLGPGSSMEILDFIQKGLKIASSKGSFIRFNSFRDEFYLRPEEILYLKADNFTTDIYLLNGGVIGVLRTLKVFESILPVQFVRIQKSIIINTYYLYHVNGLKRYCKLMGVPTAFRFSKKFVTNKINLVRWQHYSGTI